MRKINKNGVFVKNYSEIQGCTYSDCEYAQIQDKVIGKNLLISHIKIALFLALNVKLLFTFTNCCDIIGAYPSLNVFFYAKNIMDCGLQNLKG